MMGVGGQGNVHVVKYSQPPDPKIFKYLSLRIKLWWLQSDSSEQYLGWERKKKLLGQQTRSVYSKQEDVYIMQFMQPHG